LNDVTIDVDYKQDTEFCSWIEWK